MIRLPPDWEQQRADAEAAGLDPMRAVSVRLGVAAGDISDQCDYRPDPEVWAFYRDLEPQP